MRRTAFTIDVTALAAMADKLSGINDTSIDASMVQELNVIVDQVYEAARGRMNAGINLTDAYLQSKMSVIHAIPERGLRAEIVARGGRDDQSPLGRYFVKQLTVAAPRARGDVKRGIGPGQKAAGVEVEVSRGSPKTLTHAFTMPLRAGAQAGGNGLGIFTRSKYGLVKHRYGPAVYQLFRVAAGELEESTADTIEARLGRIAEEALAKGLA